MATERNSAPLAGYFKFTDKGQAIAGTLRGIHKGVEDSLFAVFSPALVFDGKNKKGEAWQAVATTLSADLKGKLDPDRKGSDFGKHFSVTFSSTEPSGKPSPKKIFRVMELSVTELQEIAKTADKTHRNEPYPRQEKTAPAEDEPTTGDDDEELPF